MEHHDYFSKKSVLLQRSIRHRLCRNEALLKAGATVIMADRNTKNLEEAVERLMYIWRARSFHDS